ncbi:monosaccharide ABC transporter ATP-binding protein (CUT2 family) [Anaerobacterium chartisolvens]|uniref:Ribose/galactose/methyl galactoside import ATP-binding protein n=2 Tax=Anaerobacterium chartisolvens TaxID=1297424 RepID=A0A369BBQ1_9FIRM|nr:monosaccharide ABC transporter ATP-binding protein (CUT2 family) [Anaerobacterium chartisolvens]
MAEYVLQMKGVSKAFPGVKALDNVSLNIRPGEVHALMGENGAGKSTLMKILNGMYQPDGGEIIFNGEKVCITSPTEALKIGISMIYQELNPILDMTIAQNIFIGREPMQKNRLFIDDKRLYSDAKVLLEEFKMPLNPRWKMSKLSTAQKQMVEMIKAVSLNSKLIVMDEPTSSLTEEEVNTLFATIERLKKENVPIVYISHRMEEVFMICDTVSVLRDGQYIGTRPIGELDKNSLISMMVGRELKDIFPKTEVQTGETVLEVKSLSKKGVFNDISFKLQKGEILGLYGLVGAGRSEIMRAIFGLDSYSSGEIILNGKALKAKNTKQVIENGVSMVTEDRKELGLVLCRSLKENISLASLDDCSKGPFVKRKLENERCVNMTSKMRVKMSSLKQNAESLSGGNQQKIVLCKWLMKNPRILILDEPTRGIDVGAKAEIYQLMSTLASQGLAVIMISSELPEVIGMSDRILVVGEGKIKGEFAREDISQDDLLACALGGDK